MRVVMATVNLGCFKHQVKQRSTVQVLDFFFLQWSRLSHPRIVAKPAEVAYLFLRQLRGWRLASCALAKVEGGFAVDSFAPVE